MKYGMKLSNYDIAMIGNLSALTEDKMKGILVDKGDIDPIKRVPLVGFLLEDFDDSFEMPNGKSMKRANRRKATFHKKEERKDLAQKLGYSVGTEYNNKKVKDLLSSNHTDRTYLRGEKVESKHTTVKEEISMMDKENWEKARNELMQTHDAILGGIACDLETLSFDMRDNEYSIENLEKEYEALREEMELVAEKLKNAKLRKNGIQAALVQNKSDFATLSANFEKERIRRFGW